MLKYKGILLRNEDVEEKGIELLLLIEDKRINKNKDFKKMINKIVIEKFEDFYIENPYNSCYELRSNTLFTFNEEGVKNLKTMYELLENSFDCIDVYIAVFTNDFYFEENNKSYNQDEVKLDEFEKNIEIL